MASKAGLLACGLLRGLGRSRALSQSQETQSKTAAPRSQVRSAAPDSASERARYRLPVIAPPSSAEGPSTTAFNIIAARLSTII